MNSNNLEKEKILTSFKENKFEDVIVEGEKLFKQSGANDMLEKPFQLKDVLDLIKLEVNKEVDGD